MGQSSSAYQSQISSVLSQAIFNSMLVVQNQNSSNCNSTQIQSFQNGATGVINCASVNLTQIAQNVCTAQSNFMTNVSAQITTVINNAISQMATQNQKIVQDFLATALSNNVSNTQLISHIQNIINTNLNTTLTTSCINNAAVIQQGTFINNGTINCMPSVNPDGTKNPGALNINQNAQLQAISSCVANTVFQVLANDQLLGTIATQASQTQTVTQAGPAAAIANALGKLFSNPAVIVIVIILIIAGLIFVIFRYGKKSPNPYAMLAQAPLYAYPPPAMAASPAAASPLPLPPALPSKPPIRPFTPPSTRLAPVASSVPVAPMRVAARPVARSIVTT